MSDTVLLEFLQADGIYQPGETAAFGEQVAQQILSRRRVRREGAAAEPVARIFTGTPGPAAASLAPAVPPVLISVEFDRWCGKYAAGETAAFPSDVAKVLVEGGQWEGVRRGPVARYAAVTPAPAPALPELSLEPEEEKPAPPRVDRMVRGDGRHDKRG